jgi:hypothetical protein
MSGSLKPFIFRGEEWQLDAGKKLLSSHWNRVVMLLLTPR